MSFRRLNVPYGWCCDDSDEEDPAPAERVRRLEDEDVLEEERVQLRQLLSLRMKYGQIGEDCCALARQCGKNK